MQKVLFLRKCFIIPRKWYKFIGYGVLYGKNNAVKPHNIVFVIVKTFLSK
jgi:hypothetical protein